MNEPSYFELLLSVDCSKHVEQKGGLSYLSWPFAVAELKRRFPAATWTVRHYLPQTADQTGAVYPYCVTPAGAFVCVKVTVEGVAHEQIHPVLDHKNKTVHEPDSYQINTSIMRCLVKAIALHGLGLYIYAGEDLPIAPASDSRAQDAANTKIGQWRDRIAQCAPESIRLILGELETAYGERKNVPSELVAAWNKRKNEIANAATTGDP